MYVCMYVCMYTWELTCNIIINVMFISFRRTYGHEGQLGSFETKKKEKKAYSEPST